MVGVVSAVMLVATVLMSVSSSGINCRNYIMGIYGNDSGSFAAHSNTQNDIGSVCCQKVNVSYTYIRQTVS